MSMWYGHQKEREAFSKQAMYLLEKADERIRTLLMDKALYFLLGTLFGGIVVSIVYVLSNYGG